MAGIIETWDSHMNSERSEVKWHFKWHLESINVYKIHGTSLAKTRKQTNTNKEVTMPVPDKAVISPSQLLWTLQRQERHVEIIQTCILGKRYITSVIWKNLALGLQENSWSVQRSDTLCNYLFYPWKFQPLTAHIMTETEARRWKENLRLTG